MPRPCEWRSPATTTFCAAPWGSTAVTSSRPSATPSVSLSPPPLMPWKQPWKRSAGSSPPSGSRPGHLGLGWLCTRVRQRREGDYFGPPLNRVAKLLSAAHGGQVVLSLPTQELVRDQPPTGTSLRDLGERRLKDLFGPERVFQLLAPELPSEFPA